MKDGDRIVIDAVKRTLDWQVDDEEQARRRQEWEATNKGKITVSRGVLLRYARDVAVSVACVRDYISMNLSPCPQPANLGAYCD